MAVQAEMVKGGSGFVASHGGSDNPAVKAIMAAMFMSDSLPALNFSKAKDVQMQVSAGARQSGEISL